MSNEGQSRYWIKRYVPGQGETFEEAKARYDKTIRQEDIDHWKKHGYVIIDRFLSPEELTDVNAAIEKYMPLSSAEYEAKKAQLAEMTGSAKGLVGANAATVRKDFPFDDDTLNNIHVHPFLVAFAERLMGTDDLALSHGNIVGKYAGTGDFDQAMHQDFQNNTYVLPTRNDRNLDVHMLIYYTDVTPDLGPTKLVSTEYTEQFDWATNPFRLHEKEDFPQLYEREIPALLPAGSVLIYSMRLFHRASAMTAKTGARFHQHTGFHNASAPYMGSMFYRSRVGMPEMNQFLVRMDPGQRKLVGFPAQNDEYWKDEEALRGVAKRYPAMDLRPYGGPAPKAPNGPPIGTTANSSSKSFRN